MIDGGPAALLDLIPGRTPADMLAGVIRFSAGGQPMTLPVRSIADNEDWLRSVYRHFSELTAQIDRIDSIELGGLVSLLGGSDDLLGFLYSYGEDNLPPRDELRKVMGPHELLIAVATIWRAANPKADAAILGFQFAMSGSSSGPTSSPSTNGQASATPGPSDRG